MAINFLGTWEQKENKTGNTGIKGNKSIFQGTGNTKIEEILLGNTGTQGKSCWEQGNMDPPGSPSSIERMLQTRLWIPD